MMKISYCNEKKFVYHLEKNSTTVQVNILVNIKEMGKRQNYYLIFVLLSAVLFFQSEKLPTCLELAMGVVETYPATVPGVSSYNDFTENLIVDNNVKIMIPLIYCYESKFALIFFAFYTLASI